MNWLFQPLQKYIGALAAILYHKAENSLGYMWHFLPKRKKILAH